jgi:hypothetical protein
MRDLKAHQATLDNLVASAPAAQKTNAQTVLNTIDAYTKADNGTGLTWNGKAQAAGNQLDSYCGLSPSATSSTS